MKLLRFSPWIVISIFGIGTVFLWVLSCSFAGYGVLNRGQELKFVAVTPSKGPGTPPVFAYWISGTKGEKNRIFRLLKAVYHPRNRYLLHLDAGSTDAERKELASAVLSEKVFKAFGNVDVVGKSYAVDRTGSSLVSSTLHGAALLLMTSAEWDWFITLSSSDYPIVAQDDLLHAFTPLPRDLNFIDHTSDLGWKEYERFRKIVIDPSLYMRKNTKFFTASEKRDMPDAFKVFTGSPWVILSRPFAEYCVHSWDNLPRKLLMYFSNMPYAMESYFQTVICNTPEFQNTTVNNDLRYFVWDNPPKLDPLLLNSSNYKNIVSSGAAFTRRFMEDDPVLQKIDESILRRRPDGVTSGKWCSGGENLEDPCSSWNDIDVVKTRPSGKKLRSRIANVVSAERLRANQCKLT